HAHAPAIKLARHRAEAWVGVVIEAGTAVQIRVVAKDQIPATTAVDAVPRGAADEDVVARFSADDVGATLAVRDRLDEPYGATVHAIEIGDTRVIAVDEIGAGAGPDGEIGRAHV